MFLAILEPSIMLASEEGQQSERLGHGGSRPWALDYSTMFLMMIYQERLDKKAEIPLHALNKFIGS